MEVAVRSELAAIQPLDEIELGHLEDALAWVDYGAPLFRTEKPAVKGDRRASRGSH